MLRSHDLQLHYNRNASLSNKINIFFFIFDFPVMLQETPSTCLRFTPNHEK